MLRKIRRLGQDKIAGEANQDLIKIEQKVSHHNSKLNNLKTDYVNTRSQVEELSRQKEIILGQINKAKEEYQKISSELNQISSELSGFKVFSSQEKDKISKEVLILNEQKESLLLSISKLGIENDSVQKNINLAKEKLVVLKSDGDKIINLAKQEEEKVVFNISTQKNNFDREVLFLSERKIKLEAEIKSINSFLSSIVEKHLSSKKDLENLTIILSNTKDQINDKAQELSGLEKQILDLKVLLNNNKEEFDKQKELAISTQIKEGEDKKIVDAVNSKYGYLGVKIII